MLQPFMHGLQDSSHFHSDEHASGMRSEHLKAIAQALESGVASAIGEELVEPDHGVEKANGCFCSWGEHMSDSIRWVWRMISDVRSRNLF